MFYMGFTKLEEFISAIDAGLACNLAPLTQTRRGDHISTVVAFVIASQVKGDHLIYCRMNVTHWSELYGKPFGESDQTRAQCAPALQHKLWTIAAARLRQGNPDQILYEGAPSFPDNLILIEGWLSGVSFDKQTCELIEDREEIYDPA